MITQLQSQIKGMFWALKEKLKVIQQIKNGKKKDDMCSEFVLIYSTFQRIWQQRTKIISAFEHKGRRIKWFQKPEQSDINEMLC